MAEHTTMTWQHNGAWAWMCTDSTCELSGDGWPTEADATQAGIDAHNPPTPAPRPGRRGKQGAPLTDEERERILALWADGMTTCEIGREINRADCTIRAVVKAAGVYEYRHHVPSGLSDAQVHALVDAYKAGASVATIAATSYLADSTVRSYLTKAGVYEPRRRVAVTSVPPKSDAAPEHAPEAASDPVPVEPEPATDVPTPSVAPEIHPHCRCSLVAAEAPEPESVSTGPEATPDAPTPQVSATMPEARNPDARDDRQAAIGQIADALEIIIGVLRRLGTVV